MATPMEISSEEPVPQGNGCAGGVPDRQWFVAIMRKHNTEKAAAQRLTDAGFESYVATQKELKIYPSGKRARIDRVVIPSMVFIHCTEDERLQAVKMPFVSHFLTDKAGTAGPFGRKPLATVPDIQMERLRFMLGNSDTPVTFTPTFVPGQRVRVVRGRLRGLEGTILSTPTTASSISHSTSTNPSDSIGSGASVSSHSPASSSRTYTLQVEVSLFGCASLAISPLDVAPA